MTHFIEVKKLELLEGEEVLQVGNKIMQMLTTMKGKVKQNLGLIGVYNDYIIARDRDSGKHFRFTFKRGSKGEIELLDPEEVKSVFVAVKQKVEKADLKMVTLPEITVLLDKEKITKDSVETLEAVANALSTVDDTPPVYIAIGKVDDNLWKGVL